MEDDKQSVDEIIADAVRGFPGINDKNKSVHKDASLIMKTPRIVV